MRKRARRVHDGRITTEVPDELWATDPTEAWTRRDGRCAVFAIGDQCTGEAWVDATPRMDRYAVADLLREAIADRFGSVEAGAATGLKLRHDGGFRFCSAHYQAEIDHLGIARSPAFHYEPETNGVIEKFIQTLKEHVLWSRALRHARATARPHPPVRRRLQPSTGCSDATATAAHARPATRSVTRQWHDRRVHQPTVRSTGGAAVAELTRAALFVPREPTIREP